ncbi:MAG: GNAT family N-acetyltransferase [Beijerinckiaceae bacterium]|nr:GNAT family N-acetyltransferase [Beijerinckiaceae bacterium]
MTEASQGESTTLVRPLAPGDIAALATLWVRSWQETMPAVDFEARRPWIAGFLAGDGLSTLVAEAGALQGFVTLEPARAYLHQLVVSPEVKGRGVAGALLDAAKALLPDGLTLDVNQANARAARFYEREGFARVGEGVNAASGLATWRMVWAGK